MDTIAEMRRIYGEEGSLRAVIDEAFAEWMQFILNLNRGQHVAADIMDTKHIMGSLHDGAYSARMFTEENLTIEADFMVEIAEIPQQAVTAVHERPGFYLIRNDGKFMDYLIGAARHFRTDPRTAEAFNQVFLGMSMGLGHGFIMGTAIKQLVQHVAGLEDGTTEVTNVMAELYGVPPSRIRCDMVTEFNGPAATQMITVFVDGLQKLAMSFDVVVAGRLSFWPVEARDWEHRRRQWPPRSVVEQIIREHKVQLVAKPSSELQMEHSSEWRLTFLAERRLIEEQTDEMKFTYYLFKILFYKYFKADIDGKSLASYLAKTTMFWLCEEVGTEIWTAQNINANLKVLLEKLFDSLDASRLPQYFIPAINLLGPDKRRLVERARAMEMRPRLLADPVACLPACFQATTDRLSHLRRLGEIWIRDYRQLAEYHSYPVPPAPGNGPALVVDEDDLD